MLPSEVTRSDNSRAVMPGLASPGVRPIQPREYERISTFIYEHCGIRLGPSKQALVSSRLNRQIEALGLPTFTAYLDRVMEDGSGELLDRMTDLLTTNFTSFFREKAHFVFLGGVFERLEKRAEKIRIWSAACSTGEEPYSIAIAAAQYGLRERVIIEASDISTRVLEKARRAVYPIAAVDGLALEMRREFFLKGTGGSEGLCRVIPPVVKQVQFEQLNLTQPFTRPGKYDMIWCRNVMIYFDKSTQEQVVASLAEWLLPGGYLLIGHSEALSGMNHRLQYVQPAVYQKGR